MAKPQQPEIARSGRGATDPAAVKSELTARRRRPVADAPGPVPEDSSQGHHPDHEQDKPSGDAFVQKLHEHAQKAPAPGADDEPDPTVAGDALRAAAQVVRGVRQSLPGG